MKFRRSVGCNCGIEDPSHGQEEESQWLLMQSWMSCVQDLEARPKGFVSEVRDTNDGTVRFLLNRVLRLT